MNHKSVGSDAGFTLLETLVALIVLGFVVGGLAAGLRFGRAAWDRQAADIDRDGALDATDRTLKTLIAGMAPGEDPRSPAIVGAQDRLAFTATLPAGAPGGDFRLADLVLSVDEAHRLILRWTLHLHAKLLVPQTPNQAVLLSGIAGLTLAYYRSGSTEETGGWVDHWSGGDPPVLVRLHISFLDAPRHWPDLIVAPMRRNDID